MTGKSRRAIASKPVLQSRINRCLNSDAKADRWWIRRLFQDNCKGTVTINQDVPPTGEAIQRGLIQTVPYSSGLSR